MGTVWVRGQADVLVRADSIVVLAIAHGALNAECLSGRTVRLADSECPGALQLALLDEIRRASADDRHAVVILPPAEQDSATWRRECADTLLELQVARDSRLPAPGGERPHPRASQVRLPRIRMVGCLHMARPVQRSRRGRLPPQRTLPYRRHRRTGFGFRT
jgi:hypothetical protein